MAPPKREATGGDPQESKQAEEVCKRLKGEPKSEAPEKPQNKNNNNNNNNNNNSTKEPADKNHSVAKATNGNAKKSEPKSESKPESKSSAKKDEEEEEEDVGEEDEEDEHDDDDDDHQEDEDEPEEDAGEEEEEPKKTNGKKADSKQATSAATAADNKKATPEPEEEPSGTLLICGGANWDMTGRKELPKTAKKPAAVDPAARNLWGPHKVQLPNSDKRLRVRGVFSGSNACHSVIVTDEGEAMTFGRNDKGQLGLGDTETRTLPCAVEALNGINIVAAACGRSHTLFLSADGIVFSCGDNKMGQCGTNQMAVQQITTPTRVAFKENKPVVKIACGAEFSMIVDIEGRLYSFGHPEHGQLGHNSEGKYFTSGNKYAFHCEYAPRRILTFIEKSREGHVSPVDDVRITDVACGANHTLAVDKRHRCFSWGFAGYHRLGHSETKNELVPRSIKVFDADPNSGRGAWRVFAGASHSLALDVNGLLYFWGQNKSSGEATMYPKTVQDLCGWRIRIVASANRSIFVVADDSCISWGPSPTYGELGYGEGKSKSSTVPQEVKTLDGLHVMNVACGFGHTLLIARDESSEEQAVLEKFSNWP